MSNIGFDEKDLDSLSPQEREFALKILKEMESEGKSKTYDDLIYADYKEIPVDIVTFLHEPKYLGNALLGDEGKFTLFPYWEEKLKEIFPDNLTTKYNTAIFTGAIGLGKSTVAVIAVLYQLYRMMCLKNPYAHYGLQEIDLITFAFMNITLDAAKGVAWDKCQQMLQRSEWFMERGQMSTGGTPTWKPPQGIELITGSLPRHIIGRAVFACFIDEINFQNSQDVEKQRKKAKEIVSAAATRMQSRFMKGEKNPTILLLASSKSSEKSYLETFIADKKRNESKTTVIVDEPQWVIRTDKDSPRKFKVAVGNMFLDSELLPLDISETDVNIYRDRGFSIIDVPIGYLETFKDDLDQALMDIAGISVGTTSRYISGTRLLDVKDSKLQNPFSKDVLEIGNAKEDTAQYSDFFDMSKIPIDMKYKPLFIHLDMSLSGDKTGIAGVWIKGKKPPSGDEPQSNDLFFQVAFSVSIKAPKGHQVSFEKNKNFIRWLKQQGFCIKKITCDTFQSASTLQELLSEGYDASILSVDRVQNKVCLPYQYFKNVIYERRISLYYKCDLLTEEIINLERDNASGKIDHPDGGKYGSKDQCDAVVGALYMASQSAEQFAYDFGETLDTIENVNTDGSTDRKQINIEFEEELSKMQDPLLKVEKDHRIDFGFGKSQDLDYGSVSSGIILF